MHKDTINLIFIIFAARFRYRIMKTDDELIQ